MIATTTSLPRAPHAEAAAEANDTRDAVAIASVPEPVSLPHESDAVTGEPLLAHSYDGIREYDNPLPGWWNVVFGASIAFAFLYFAYYNIAGWGQTPGDRYKVALAGWQAVYKGSPGGGGGGPDVSEEMLASGAQSPEVVARGAEVFAARCTGCHGPQAAGQIGPNLTDLFQLHGTTRMDLYGTIIGGVPGTAMIAWGEVMKPADIVSVATYVSSLRGKNLTGKEPQGKPVPSLAR